MKVYLITSNKYTLKVCPINIHFLNKYWKNIDITIVGYEDVDKLENLPNNVKVANMGIQEDFGNTWTTALIPFFENVPEEYFVTILDDYILMNPVDESKIATIEEQFKFKRVQKAMIGGGIPLSSASEYTENLLIFNQNIPYRTSLHPSIWDKQYFLKYLKPGMTAWDFELKNDAIARNDKAKIINYKYEYPKEPHLYSYLDLYTGGQLNINEQAQLQIEMPSSRHFDNDDIRYIWESLQK